MASIPIRDQQVYVGALKLGGQLHTINLRSSFEALDDARLGDATAKVTLGRGMTDLSLAGFWDPANYASIDSQLFSDQGAERAYIIDVTGAGEGGVCYFGDALVSARDLDMQHGKLGAMTIAGATRNSIPMRGYLSEVSEGLGAGTVNGTGINLGAVGSGEKLWAAVCMYGGSTPNVDVIIESDADNGFASPITRITFTNRTTVGGQLSSAAGPITDGWFRAKVTVNSGSGVAVAVAVGISF